MTPKKFDAEIVAYLNLGQRQIFDVNDSTAVDIEKIVVEPLDPNDAAALIANRHDDAETFARPFPSTRRMRAHFLLGVVQPQRDSTDQNRQDRLIDAWNQLKAATRLNPGLAEPHNQLAFVLEKLQDADGAITEATTAAHLNQGNERYFVHLAELYFTSKKFDKASLLFEQLTASNDPAISSLAAQRLQSLKTLNSQQKPSSSRPSKPRVHNQPHNPVIPIGARVVRPRFDLPQHGSLARANHL